MAETTSTPSAPNAGEQSAERAPAEVKAGTVESASEPTKEKGEEKANGAEEKPSGNTTAPEDKKDSADAPSDKPAALTDSTDVKKPDETTVAPAESGSAAAPAPNGTPRSAKKGGAKRKSTGGVSEHKAKLSRKKSQSRITQLNAKPGEYYLARLRSFPPWPAIICDEEILPQTLLSSRPVTARRPDGSYRDDYADEGKRAVERTFPVMFLETNEFAWIPNTDLVPLDPATCKDISEKGKSKLLVAAYGVAAENNDLKYYKELLADHQRAIQQEEEEREAQEAAKAASKAQREAKKNKRKSMEIVDVEMDEADEDSKKPKSSKKRKKDDADAEDKPAKTPKTATKLKLTTPKTPASESGKKAPGSSKARQTASNKKSGKASESEGSRPVSKEPEKQINQEEAKERKEREVLFVRHRLQKGFISRDQPPKDEDMATMSGYLTKLENIPELEVSIIRSTKIHKVLRMIIKLSSIPRDEEFQFRQRALDILSKWKNVLEADTATPSEEKEKDDKPKANGVHKEGAKTEAKDEKEEGSREAKQHAPEPQEEPMPDADASEKTEKPETPAAPAKSEGEGKDSEAKTSEGKTAEDKPAAEKKEATAV